MTAGPMHLKRLNADVAPLAALLPLAMGLFVLNTWQGIGVIPDSTRYMELVSTPYDAPLYTWALRAGDVLTGDKIRGATILGFVVICINTVLVYWTIARALPGQWAPAVLGTLIILLNPTFLSLSTMVMSEALFLAVLLASVIAFRRAAATGETTTLVFSGLLLGLAALARFVAVPMGAALATFTLLFDRSRQATRRWRDVLILFSVSAALFFTWVVASKLALGRAVGRDLWFYGNPTWDLWLGGLSVLASFLLPRPFPEPARAAALIAAVVACLWIVAEVMRRSRRPGGPGEAEALIIIFGVFALYYLAFVVLSVLLEANLQLSSRYSLLLFICGVFITVTFAGLCRVEGHRRLGALAAAGLLLLFGLNAARSAILTRDAMREGVGYQSLAWRTSPTIAAVRALPDDARIFSNGSDPLNYLTGRRSDWIPALSERRTGLDHERGSFPVQLAAFKADMANGAYAVFFDAIDWRFFFASEEDLVREAGLVLHRSEADGRIYRAAAAEPP